MDNNTQPAHRSRFLLLAGVGVIVAAWLYTYAMGLERVEPSVDASKITSEITYSAPTDFVEIGTLTFNTPGQEEDVPYLMYEEPGLPARSMKLVFDPLSACMVEWSAAPCVAMSVTLDVPFNGKRAVVEGILDQDTVLVRKLQILREGAPETLWRPGSIFISWPDAVRLIEACQPEALMQSHRLDVYLTLDDKEVRAVEPVIDEVFRIVERTEDTCGSIPLATE